MTVRRGETPPGNTLPVAWGVQPDDEYDLSWTARCSQGSGLRAPTEPIHGGRVTEAPGTAYTLHGNTPQHKQKGGEYAGHLVQCWCGLIIGPGTPAMTRNGDTFACDNYRCSQIAAMPPHERLRRRPGRLSSGTPRRREQQEAA
jgi:hypothetical protein